MAPTSLPIGAEVAAFINDIDSLEETYPLSMIIIERAHRHASGIFKDFVEKHSKAITAEDGKVSLLLDPDYYHRFNHVYNRQQRISRALQTVPRTFLVALVSQYDAFLGRLVRALFYLRPEKLKSCDRTLSFFQLAEFPSLDEAKDYIVEKEVESLLRKSHSEQFDWLEGKFDLPLRKDLPRSVSTSLRQVAA